VIASVRFAVVVVLAAGTLGLTACAQNPCDVESKCSADPRLTEAEKTRCRTDLDKDPCKADLDAYLSCRNRKRVCTAENRTDENGTAQACTEENNRYVTCLGNAAQGPGAD
jgi:hypothetical protein